MAKENKRCPLQPECGYTCGCEGMELDCDYYYANACGENVVEDQEDRREANWKKLEMKQYEDKELLEQRVEKATAEILLYKRQAVAAFLEIGQRLIEVKELLPHGDWLDWLKEKVDFSESSAQRFMRLAKEYANPSPVTDLGASKALVLLALPASEREEFVAETHLVNGEEKMAADMTKKELEKVIRERDEAKKLAEHLRQEIADQMDEQQKVYDTDTESLKAELQDAREELSKANSFLKKREQELQELRSKPVEVAVEKVVDPDAIRTAEDAAAQKATAAMEKKLAAAEKAKADADKAVEESRAKVAALEARKKALQEELETERKKDRAPTGGHAQAFRVHFDNLQANVNAMKEIIAELTASGDTEQADKLRGALQKVLQKALDVVT